MKREDNTIEIKNYKIYYRETQRGWSIVIRPNNIRIDNFHGLPHIHYTLKDKHTLIKTESLTESLIIVLDYLSQKWSNNTLKS